MTVKVYSTETCHYCHMVKYFLRKNNVEFQEIDVSADQKAANEMVEKSGQMGVPVVEIDGKIIIGFNTAAIKEALHL